MHAPANERPPPKRGMSTQTVLGPVRGSSVTGAAAALDYSSVRRDLGESSPGQLIAPTTVVSQALAVKCDALPQPIDPLENSDVRPSSDSAGSGGKHVLPCISVWAAADHREAQNQKRPHVSPQTNSAEDAFEVVEKEWSCSEGVSLLSTSPTPEHSATSKGRLEALNLPALNPLIGIRRGEGDAEVDVMRAPPTEGIPAQELPPLPGEIDIELFRSVHCFGSDNKVAALSQLEHAPGAWRPHDAHVPQPATNIESANTGHVNRQQAPPDRRSHNGRPAVVVAEPVPAKGWRDQALEGEHDHSAPSVRLGPLHQGDDEDQLSYGQGEVLYAPIQRMHQTSYFQSPTSYGHGHSEYEPVLTSHDQQQALYDLDQSQTSCDQYPASYQHTQASYDQTQIAHYQNQASYDQGQPSEYPDQASYDHTQASYEEDQASEYQDKASYDLDQAFEYQGQASYDQSRTSYDQGQPSDYPDQASYNQTQASYEEDQASEYQDKASYDLDQAFEYQGQASYDQSQTSYDQGQPSDYPDQASYDQGLASEYQDQALYDQTQALYDQTQASYDQGLASEYQDQASYDQGLAFAYQGQASYDRSRTSYDQGQPSEYPDQASYDQGQTSHSYDLGQAMDYQGRSSYDQDQASYGQDQASFGLRQISSARGGGGHIWRATEWLGRDEIPDREESRGLEEQDQTDVSSEFGPDRRPAVFPFPMPSEQALVELSAAEGNRVHFEDQRRHLQVWERFFENAFALKQAQDEGSQGEGGQSEGSGRGVIVSFTSALARKFFATALPAYTDDEDLADNLLGKARRARRGLEEGWRVLASAARYQSLVRLAKAAPRSSMHGDSAKGALVRYLALYAAVITGDAAALQALMLEGGGDLHVGDDKGRGLLHYAAKNNQQAVLALLHDFNIDVDQRDLAHNTPLHVAAALNRRTVAAFLLDCAADTSLRNSEGLTARELAELLGHREVATMIRSHADGVLLSPAALLGLGTPASSPTREARSPETLPIPMSLDNPPPIPMPVVESAALVQQIKRQYRIGPDDQPPSAMANGTFANGGEAAIGSGELADDDSELGDEEEPSLASLVSDRVAEQLWALAHYLISLTVSLLFARARPGVPLGPRARVPATRASATETTDTPSPTAAHAPPPTDRELQTQAFRPPPQDVVLAVAMARHSAQHKVPTTDTPGAPPMNQYSLGLGEGDRLPTGTKWRYVPYSPSQDVEL